MVNQGFQREIISVLAKYKPTRIDIFGSYARNEQTPESDLDVLVDFVETVNLIEIIGIEQELSERLGINVDLVTMRSLNPRIKQHIEKDLIPLL
jgi:uncharacterized protein